MLVQHGSDRGFLSSGHVTQIAAIQPAMPGDQEQSPETGEGSAEVAAHVQQVATGVAAMQEQLQQLSGQLADKAAAAEAPGVQAPAAVEEQLSSLLAEVSGLKGTRLCQTCCFHKPPGAEPEGKPPHSQGVCATSAT